MTNAQPNNRRAGTTTTHPLGKILVFGDYHSSMLLGVLPDGSVLALGEIDFENVFGLVPALTQPPGEGDGQLRVNQEAHNLKCLRAPDS